MVNKRRKIIMDCDPGIDDAVALCVAAAHPEAFELIGITTVAGNQTIEKTTANALTLSAYYGLEDVPVAMGAVTPILRPALTAADIHGANGMGDVAIPATDKKPASNNAVLFLKQLIDSLPEDEKVTLVPTGPFTNIALLFCVFPEVKERIEEIVLMGGAAFGGNITSTGEFNVYEDPEAAAIVFNSGLPIVMCGLDATEKCGLDAEAVQYLMDNGGELARTVAQMVQFYFKTPSYENQKMACIHDSVTYMYMLHPEIFKAVKMPVSVDCSEGTNRGMTICDPRTWAYESEPTTTVLMDADGVKFREYLVESILKLDRERSR